MSAAFQVNLTFTESVTGLELSDLTVGNGTASDLSGSGASYTVTVTPASDGAVSVGLPAASATDEAGNGNTVSNTLTIEADLTAPTAAISTTSTSPVSGAFQVTLTFSEAVTGVELSDLVVGNGTASGLSGSGSVYTATITPAADGNVTVDLSAGAAQDAAGNGNTAAPQFVLEYDIDPPSTSLSVGSNQVTGPFNVQVRFSKPVTGFVQADISTDNGDVTQFSQTSDREFMVEVTPLSVGTVSIRVPAGAAQDVIGQDSSAAALSVEAIIETQEVTIEVSSTTSDVGTVLGQTTLKNPGGQPLEFSASTDVNWLVVTPESGQIPALGTLQFQFRLTEEANLLAPGTYNATVRISRAANIVRSASPTSASTPPELAAVPITLRVEERSGTLRIVSATPAGSSGDAVFRYVSNTPEVDGLTLSTTGGRATSSDIELRFGSYSIRQITPAGWRLDAISCSGDADSGSAFDIASESAVIDLDPNEVLTCTFSNSRDEDLVRSATQRVINNFLVRRGEQIVESMPDLSRRLESRTHRTGGAFQANATEGYRIASLDANVMPSAADNDNFSGLGGWTSARFAGVSDERAGDAESDFTLLQFGADWAIRSNLLVGGLVQLDWMDETQREVATAAGGIRKPTIKGDGWMIGPYAVWQPADQLIVNGAFLAGSSQNQVNPLGLYEDDFDTDRYLLNVGFTGLADYGNWQFRPNVAATYFEDTQAAYKDSLGYSIPEQSVEMGRISFGPEVLYVQTRGNGLSWSFGGSLDGIWAFDQAALLTDTGQTFEQDDLSLRAELALSVDLTDKLALRFEASSVGLGSSDYSSEAVRFELTKSFGTYE